MASIIERARNTISSDAHKVVGSARRHIDNARSEIIREAGRIGDDIHHAETAISTAGHNAVEGLSSAAHEIRADISGVVHSIPNALSSAGGYVEQGVLSVGDVISNLEKDILPSPSSVITETGLIVAAIGVIGLIALKFL